jgi:hypothetical protein
MDACSRWYMCTISSQVNWLSTFSSGYWYDLLLQDQWVIVRVDRYCLYGHKSLPLVTHLRSGPGQFRLLDEHGKYFCIQGWASWRKFVTWFERVSHQRPCILWWKYCLSFASQSRRTLLSSYVCWVWGGPADHTPVNRLSTFEVDYLNLTCWNRLFYRQRKG